MSKSALALRLEKRKKAIEAGSYSSEDAVSDNKITRTLSLASGKAVELRLYTFTGKSSIEDCTDVDASNIRNQDLLNDESLKDILSSIEVGQLYPAIGYMENGIVKVVDGSRRRKAAILRDCSFSVEVADCKISLKDAEEIVRISEQKRKLSYIEWGKYYQSKLDRNIYPSAKCLAEKEGVSTGYVSLCLNAAKLPEEIIDVFIDLSLVSSQKDTKVLVEIGNTLRSNELSPKSFIEQIQDELSNALSKSNTPEEHTEMVLAILLSSAKKIKNSKIDVAKEDKKLPKIEKLGGGVTFAIRSKDSAVINLRKVSEDKRNKIKEFIKELMN
ncbi:chromosome partitioning protein ParB [Vibrio zhanjiangensis]|uniref:Chromosome partitioning protein ParB n=1 Tax=Vibrio zhanjiangensis TaxID=1046128 RepID=A0ABQ6F5I4_9VIBR|nr:ParB/RepB/Spo0J family partition protein [Vibrio zhanjiangensis]GLT20186.1 chromosome partitioning protein ParB [Vibrio zhanjiangensis]